MSYANVTAVVVMAAAITLGACNRPEPAEAPAIEDAAAAQLRERNQQTAELEKRAADIERRWTEMEVKVKEKDRTPTPALRAEVKEDVANARQAIANLKTTSPDNWWERHENATEQTADDIEADVLRFTKGKKAPERGVAPQPVATTAGFDERRNEFVARLRTRIDGLEEQLKNVEVDGPQETEVEDTRARINKLQDDLDRLGKASPDEWWDISQARVNEYIDRVERSIRRLDDDKK